MYNIKQRVNDNSQLHTYVCMHTWNMINAANNYIIMYYILTVIIINNLVEAHCYGIQKGSGHVLSNHVAV